MAATEEGWHTCSDGMKLYRKTWKPSGPVKARLVFVHGFSDHCNTYTDLFNPLTTRNIEVHAWDQRGWGLSVQAPKQKGLTGPTSLVISDIDSVITSVITTTSDSIPLFLMGHSMGGGETLTFAAVGPPATRKHIRGYLAESPLIALAPATRPWAITEISGRMAAKVLPHFHMVNALNPALLSRDAAVGKEFAEDPLCHDTGTLEGLEGMLDRGKNLDEDGGGVVVGEDVRGQGETGVWVAHGSGDGIVDFDASRRWVERCAVQDKEFKGYEGWYHRLHQEPGECKEAFARDVADWILARV